MSTYLARKQRLWDDLMKHWKRFGRSCDTLATEDPALGLELAIIAQKDVHDLVNLMVLRMRADGASWADVGAVLGITKQGALQRFRHLELEDQGEG